MEGRYLEEKEERSHKEEIKKILIESILKKEEKENKNQTNHIIDLSFNLTSKEDFGKIFEEKFRLVLISNAKGQIKALCFQPTPSKINQRQGVETYFFKSYPIRENDDFPNIKKFDPELRTRFENTSSFPYSVHRIVRVDIGKEDYKTGTRILVATYLVLTAAHKIYDAKKSKQKYPKIEFIPGMNDQEKPSDVYNVDESYVPDEYIKTWTQEDYALLVLDGTLGVQAGYFDFHIAQKEHLKGKELNVNGYPGHVRTQDDRKKLKSSSGKRRHQLWRMKGKDWFFEDKNDNGEFLINYEDILTTPGQSGSDVFIKKREQMNIM